MTRKRLSRVNTHDYDRILLTEVAPYEVPLRFSTLFYYSRLRMLPQFASQAKLLWTQRIFDTGARKLKGGYQPYSFSIQRSTESIRRLHLMHPLGMLAFRNLYQRFGDNIASSCRRSSWSLRAPIRISKSYYDSSGGRDDGQLLIEEVAPGEVSGVELARENPPVATSFFAYSHFAYLYKFYASEDFHSLEKRFRCYLKMDVHSCFDSIYTHSVSWSMKGKEFGKRDVDLKECCDSQFDKAMQLVNHNETNGILIGPEASRVFAEIIFQAIDCAAESIIEKAGFVSGRDYAVRRYVDDYFIFYSSDDVKDVVVSAVVVALGDYKLRLNSSKIEKFNRPFTTQLSRAKQALSECVDQFLERIVEGKSRGDRRRLPRRSLIVTLQGAIGGAGVTYPECAAFVLTCLRNKFERLSEQLGRDAALDMAMDVGFIDVAFFLLAVSPQYQTGIVVARMISEMKYAAQRCGEVAVSRLRHVVAENFHSLIQLMASVENPGRFELANLFVAMDALGRVPPLPTKWIERIWFCGNEDEVDYFTTVSLLHCFGDIPEYSEVCSRLKSRAVRFLLGNGADFAKADMFMLGFDLLSCPFIDAGDKTSIGRVLGGWVIQSVISESTADQFVREVSRESWFFDWSKKRDLDYYLRKKRVSSAY